MRKTKPWELTRIPLECVENGSKFIAVTFIPKMSEFADKNLTCFQNEKKAILGKLGFITLEVSDIQYMLRRCQLYVFFKLTELC